MHMRWSFVVVGFMALVVPLDSALAQTYPTGPITFVAPFPAGGSLDVVMRAMAPLLQKSFNKPVIIENRTGAGGVIATTRVVKASPDGETLLAAASSLATNQKLSKSLPYDTLKDLQAVSLVFRTPIMLVATPSLNAKSIEELVALLKRKPGQINFAHGGIGAANHLAAELFQTTTGTKMTGIGYRGVQAAMSDLLEGRVHLMFADVGAVIEQVKAGALRPLAIASAARVPALPKVPTIAETGVPGFEAEGWTLICAPSATPKSIINVLSAELAAAAKAPEVQAIILRLGAVPVDSPSPEELQKFLELEIKRWGNVIDMAGLAGTQ